MLTRIYDKSHQGTARAMLWSRRLVQHIIHPRTSTLSYIVCQGQEIVVSSQHSVGYEISILRGISHIPKSRRAENVKNITLVFCAVAAREVSDKVSRNDSEDERTIAIGPLEQYCIKPVQRPEFENRYRPQSPNSESGLET
jgi:hypothetical protein